MPLEPDMANWNTGKGLTLLAHHSDPGSSYLSAVCLGVVVGLGAKRCTGTVDDSYRNPVAETGHRV